MAEEAILAARDHQPRAPGEHRQGPALLSQLPLQLPRHQQVAEFAVFVGLFGIETGVAIEHGRPRALAQPSQVSQAGRLAHLASGAVGVMHFRGRHHQPRSRALHQQGQQLLQ